MSGIDMGSLSDEDGKSPVSSLFSTKELRDGRTVHGTEIS
jgi:hypothetical protein